MPIIGSKATVKPIVENCLSIYHKKGITPFVNAVRDQLPDQKIRFPILEYATHLMCDELSIKDLLTACKQIIECRTIGGNVIAGIILQKHTEKNLAKAFALATDYILYGNEWYCCDIIGERVMGAALLKRPEKTIPLLKKLAKHKEDFAVRTIGVATHYAVKKGLKKVYVEEMFVLLLSLANSTGFHAKTGIGWGAKTCAKFYPDIAAKYKTVIEDQEKTGQWFRTKVKIGLGRNVKYAWRFK